MTHKNALQHLASQSCAIKFWLRSFLHSEVLAQTMCLSCKEFDEKKPIVANWSSKFSDILSPQVSSNEWALHICWAIWNIWMCIWKFPILTLFVIPVLSNFLSWHCKLLKNKCKLLNFLNFTSWRQTYFYRDKTHSITVFICFRFHALLRYLNFNLISRHWIKMKSKFILFLQGNKNILWY